MIYLLSLFTAVSAFGEAKTIIIRPGVSQTLNRNDWRATPNQEIIVQCENEPKCEIGYEYVGKKFSLKMPNGKNFAYYKSKKEAMGAAGQLISTKICDRVVLNIDNKNLAKE